MGTKKTMVYGAFKPALEERLANEASALKEKDLLAPVLVLVGSHVLGRYLEKMLADRLGSHANIRILTLRDFSERLAGNGAGSGPPAPAAIKRWIVRDISGSPGKKDYFQAVADRPGFASTLLETFDDLEQGCFQGLPGRKKWSPKVRRVFELYSCYLSGVRAEFAEDADVIEAASSRVGSVSAVFGTDRVIIYGLYDLTEIQKRLVESLAGALDVTFMVPFQQRAAFDYARPTVHWLEGLGFVAGRADEAPAVETNLDRVRVGFGVGTPPTSILPRQGGGGTSEIVEDDSIAIISAPGAAREVREIAREVLNCARERGIPFQDMAVVLRSPGDYRHLLREEFDRLGIPCYLSGGVPLIETREGRSLAMLCGLIASDLSRKSVIEFLRFSPLDMERLTGQAGDLYSPELWNKVSSEANIVRGRAQWEGRLQAYIDNKRPGEDRSGASREARDLIKVTGNLFGGMERLPPRGALPEMAGVLIDLYRSFVTESPEREKVIGSIRQLADAGAGTGPLSKEDFLAMALEHLSATTIPRGRFACGGVNVLSIMEARGTCFRLVFLPGMVEKVFPSLVSEDPVLLDRERMELNALGAGSLPLKRDRAGEEKMLFALGVAMARERLVMSYPRLDPSTGRPRVPSFFLLQAVEAYTGERANYERLEEAPGLKRVPLLAGRGLDPREAVNRAEFRAAFALSADPGVAEAARLHLMTDEKVRRSIGLMDSRFRAREFGPFDGMLAWRSARFPPGGRPFRATELEGYTRCPYRFFHERVLGLTRFEEPEELIFIDPGTRGSLVHDILKDLFSSCADGGLLPLMPAERMRHEELLRSAAEPHFSRIEREGACGLSAPWEREKSNIMAGLAMLLEDEYREGGRYMPTLFEVTFGRDEGAAPAALEIDGTARLAFKGRIDRLDTYSGGRGIRVIDYKTGRVRQKRGEPFLPENKSHPALYIQTMIYMLAAPRVLGTSDWSEITGELYYLFPGGGKTERIVYGGADLQKHTDILGKIVSAAADAIANGIFIPRPSGWCDYCDYNTACPADRRLLFRIKEDDPSVKDIAWILNGELPPDE